MAKATTGSFGCGTFCVLLFMLFLGLKLGQVGEVAAWDWIWVTAPIWGYCVFYIIVIAVVICSYCVVEVVKGLSD